MIMIQLIRKLTEGFGVLKTLTRGRFLALGEKMVYDGCIPYQNFWT